MPAFYSSNDLGAERQERLWSILNAAHGGRLEARAKEIRSGPVHITKMEARMGVVAEMLNYDCWRTAKALGINVHTVENHRSDIRKKIGLTRKDSSFDMISINYTPPCYSQRQSIRRRRRKRIMNNAKTGSFIGVFREYNSAKLIVIL